MINKKYFDISWVLKILKNKIESNKIQLAANERCINDLSIKNGINIKKNDDRRSGLFNQVSLFGFKFSNPKRNPENKKTINKDINSKILFFLKKKFSIYL